MVANAGSIKVFFSDIADALMIEEPTIGIPFVKEYP